MALPLPPARPFAELRDSGLLWLINRVVFHPRRVALALHADETGHMYGWSLLPSPDGGPWTYPEDIEPRYLRAAEATLTTALTTPVRPDEDVRPSSRPHPDEDTGRPGRAPVLGCSPPLATSADAVRPGADEGTDGDRTRDRRTEVRQAIGDAFLTPDTDACPPWSAPERSGIRGLLEHVGMDLTGRVVDHAPRCSCGLTGDLLAVDPAGGHAHAVPDEEQTHPAVAWWASAYERATVAEVRLSAVRDVLDDMEHTTGARHWARLLRQAAGTSHQDDYGGPHAWRRRAVRRALAISRLTGTITAVCDLAHEDDEEMPGERGDGYRQALADLRDVLAAFGHLPDAQSPGADDLVHRCTDPQARALVEVDDLTIPVVHHAYRDEGTP